MNDLSIVILAAGDGTRMKSSTPKLLHEVAGAPIIQHVVNAAKQSGAKQIGVVTAADNPALRSRLESTNSDLAFFEQQEKLGTGHAAKMAEPIWSKGEGNVAFVYGDHPLLEGETFAAIQQKLADGWDGAILGFEPEDPTGYGRLVTAGDELIAITEHKDADAETRKIGLCNACILAFSKKYFRKAVENLSSDNAQNEFYLTDLVELVRAEGGRVSFAVAAPEIVVGVNSREQLAEAEGYFQDKMRRHFLANGVTLRDPSSVYFSFDTQIAADVTIEQNVVFGKGVSIQSGAIIRAFSHIEGANVGSGAIIGPYARLRPGADIGTDAHVGNFSEVKKSSIGEGSKVNHLSYIGDATIGAKTNIGAGTITCNYDGVNKHHTEIGAGVFVGSNTALVSPVTIGDGASIAAGSTITKNVEDDALAVARSRQTNKPDYAKRLRARAMAMKKK